MKKLFGGTLVLALASLAMAAPQNPPATGDNQSTQTGSKQTGKKHTGKHQGKKNGKNAHDKNNSGKPNN